MKNSGLIRRVAVPALLLLVACAGGQSGTTTEGTAGDTWGCVNSQWEGELAYGGSWLDVQACMGNECTGVERVNIVDGTSCYVPAELAPSETERPSSAGPPMEDLAHTAVSGSGNTGFRICAFRAPTPGNGGPGDMAHLDVVIQTLEQPAEDSIPERASLRVNGDDGTALVDTEMHLDIPEGHYCPGFSVDLDGTAVTEELGG
jgi:hypothetical protein